MCFMGYWTSSCIFCTFCLSFIQDSFFYLFNNIFDDFCMLMSEMVLMDHSWIKCWMKIFYLYCFNNLSSLILSQELSTWLLLLWSPKVYYNTFFFPWIIMIINTCESSTPRRCPALLFSMLFSNVSKLL